MTKRMVRRRTRAIKIAASTDIDNNGSIRRGNDPSCLLEDQYFASPKRKDCKVESNLGIINEKSNKSDRKKFSKTKSKNMSAKSERGGINGPIIGVPLATRSQTKTIDKFFKLNAKSMKSTNEQTLTSISPVPSQPPHALTNGNQSPINKQSTNSDVIFDESDDTDDTCTELSDEYQINGHRRRQIESAHIDDSDSGVMSMGAPYYCASRSSIDNIFLQEPVLSLNVDKTPNQATSIKINKTLATEPVFSSPSALVLTTTINGLFSPIVTRNSSSPKKELIDFNTKSDFHQLSLDNDNSSCDSGVAFTPSENNNSVKIANSSQRKPATPHRIVCPSPIKSVPNSGRLKSPSAAPVVVSTAIDIISSPTKRHPKKSRKKLNQVQKSSPSKRHQSKKDYKHNRRNINRIHDDDNDADDDQEYENLEEISEIATVMSAPTHKPILNSTVNPTAQQNSDNNNCNVTKVKHIVEKSKASKSLAAIQGNRELSEFFPVRRSVRKTKTVVKEEMMRNLEKAIIEELADGLKIAHFEGKGRGIIADRRFQRGEFVVEYIGDLINMTEAAKREKGYALDENTGCYMYYFKHKNQQYCIDATADTGKLGRLVNHSRTGNLLTKVVVVKARPHLVLIAKDDIEPGEELTYDYGDRSKEALLHHPWLAF